MDTMEGDTMSTDRQRAWIQAAEQSNEPAATLFRLIALPNENERGHRCDQDAVGFRRDGRRGFRCGICGTVLKWVDPERGHDEH